MISRAQVEAIRARRLQGATPAKGNNRRAGGRAANRSGNALEAAIMYAARHSCIALHQLPKCGARFTGAGQAHHLPIPCDFVGAEVATGRGVYFDAKHCGPKRASFQVGSPAILKLHQRAFLIRMSKAGAIAGLLVRCDYHGCYYWIDGKMLETPAANIAWFADAWKILGTDRIDFNDLSRLYAPNTLERIEP